MQVKTERYEGPLDMLIYLIQKNELNIFEVSIAVITDKFVEEIRRLKSLDVEVASEFIELASYLVYLKSRYLLPREEGESLEEERDFTELLKQAGFCKELSHFLEKKGEKRFNIRKSEIIIPLTEKYIENPYKLAEIFFKLSTKRKPRETLIVQSLKDEVEKITIHTKEVLAEREKTLWSFLAKIFPEKFERSVAFSTVLELSRQSFVRSYQEGNFTDFLIKRTGAKSLTEVQESVQT